MKPTETKPTYNGKENGKEIVPIFFAVDDKYAPYLAVSARSLIDHVGTEYTYKIYVLIDKLSEKHCADLKAMEKDNVTVDFVVVTEKLDELGGKLHLRDYYSRATYYRFFIPDLFPEYKRGLYFDCDVVFLEDVAKLYNTDMGTDLLACVPDEVVLRVDVFGRYAEKVLGIPREEYFNAGVMVMNLEGLREAAIETAFVEILSRRTYRVAQDQDYLNELFYGRTTLLPIEWNKTANEFAESRPFLIHYKINWKPWHYQGICFEDEFWRFAKKTPYYEELLAQRDHYTDAEKARDHEQYLSLEQLALHDTAEAERCGIPERLILGQDKDRLLILDKIQAYERIGYFDRDVENDPPSRPLKPGEVDYTGRKLSTRIATRFANRVAQNFFEKKIQNGELVIKEIRGIENYLAVARGGVMITCNHFNAFDNYAVFKAIEPHLGKQNLYKIIREGNYTSYKGLYGFFFRHCNTLPLSTRMNTLRELIEAVQTLLKRGEKILIYPEQGMWWNYRKPRPLKQGAFRFAAKAGVPVVPMFITTEDTDKLGADGFPIKAYTVHVLPAIHPSAEKNVRENTEAMCLENYRLWKETYEDFYGVKLLYTTETEVNPCSI